MREGGGEREGREREGEKLNSNNGGRKHTFKAGVIGSNKYYWRI